jgi:hypothetical protein
MCGSPGRGLATERLAVIPARDPRQGHGTGPPAILAGQLTGLLCWPRRRISGQQLLQELVDGLPRRKARPQITELVLTATAPQQTATREVDPVLVDTIPFLGISTVLGGVVLKPQRHASERDETEAMA